MFSIISLSLRLPLLLRLLVCDMLSMGLNLNIRRIIFNSVYKHDGDEIVRLSHSAVKQIAGRAGRRNSPYPEGVVTCRDPRDLTYIRQCMNEEISPIVKAGLIPTAKHLKMFQEAMHEYHFGTTTTTGGSGNDDQPRTHLHSLLEELHDLAVVKGDYFLCRQEDMVTIAKWLRDVDLEITDKFVFCVAPVNTDIPTQKDVMLKFGKKLAAGEVRGCLVEETVVFGSHISSIWPLTYPCRFQVLREDSQLFVQGHSMT